MSLLTAELTNSPQHLILRLEKGQPFTFTSLFVDQAGAPVDLTDCELEFAISKPAFRGGGVILNPLATITPGDNEAVTAFTGAQLNLTPGDYPFTVTLVTPVSYSAIIAKGTVQILPNGSTINGISAGVTPDTLTFRILKTNQVTVTVNHMPVPNLSAVMTVLAEGKAPTVEITGVWPNQVVKFGLPASGQVNPIDVATQAELDAAVASFTAALAGKADTVHAHAQADVTGLVAALAAKEATANKGQPNGYASLDSTGRLPISQMQPSVMTYEGTWNAATNTPTLTAGLGSPGAMYRVSVAGTRDVGDGSVTFNVGDYVVCNSVSNWQQIDGTDAVFSVAGKTGAVTLVKADVGLNNVDNTSDANKPVSTAQATSIGWTAGSRWDSTVIYPVGAVVGYAGATWKATAISQNKVPVLFPSSWMPLTGPPSSGWAQPDPYFEGDDFNSYNYETFWKTGTSTCTITTTAGEFENGRQALKIALGASSSQRIYSREENIVKGGEWVQLQVRAKLTAAAAGVTLSADIQQNDAANTPSPLATGAVGTASIDAAATLTTTWQTYTFRIKAANAKPRAAVSAIVSTGAAAANVVFDWMRTTRIDGDGDWIAPALQNSWVNYDATGATWETVGYMKSGRWVELRGLIRNGTVTSGTVLFIMPPGYCPSQDKHIGTVSNGATATINVMRDGTVKTNLGVSATWLSLANIRWLAEK